MRNETSHKNFQALERFLNGKEEKLSPKQLTMFTRFEKADNIIRKWGNGPKALKMIAEINSTSRTVAFQDMRSAQLLFGSIQRSEKEYWRNLAVERLNNAYHLAMEKITGLDRDGNVINKDDEGKPIIPEFHLKELKVVAEINAELRRTIKYDELDLDIPDFSEMDPHINEMTFDPTLIGAKPLKNIDQLMERFMDYSIPDHEIIQDVEYEELDDDGTE